MVAVGLGVPSGGVGVLRPCGFFEGGAEGHDLWDHSLHQTHILRRTVPRHTQSQDTRQLPSKDPSVTGGASSIHMDQLDTRRRRVERERRRKCGYLG